MMDETKKTEEELLEVLKAAKQATPRIYDINVFTEKVYSLVLSTVIYIERKIIEQNNAHATFEFKIADYNSDCTIRQLISLVDVINFSEVDDPQYFFDINFTQIIKECNVTGSSDDFVLPNSDVAKFYTQFKELLKKNTALSLNDNTGDNSKFKLSLNLEYNFK